MNMNSNMSVCARARVLVGFRSLLYFLYYTLDFDCVFWHCSTLISSSRASDDGLICLCCLLRSECCNGVFWSVPYRHRCRWLRLTHLLSVVVCVGLGNIFNITLIFLSSPILLKHCGLLCTIIDTFPNFSLDVSVLVANVFVLFIRDVSCNLETSWRVVSFLH